MRKLNFIGIILSLVFIFGCVGISFKAPTSQMLIKNAAVFAGYEIGKAKPELATEIIHYTQVDREDILIFYGSWRRYLAYRLSDDPIHRRLIGNMLGLIELELKSKSLEEQEKIIRDLFTELISGLEAGIAVSLK